MTAVLLVVVLLATAAAIGGGLYVTLRAFKAVDRPPVEPKPKRAMRQRHDAAMTAQLRHFFEGKQCAECGRPIPPVHIGEQRPGLLNAEMREAIAWDDIPPANLEAMLDSHQPLCSNCLITETFRREHPELIIDRHRTVANPWH